MGSCHQIKNYDVGLVYRKSDITKKRQIGNSFKRATEYYLLERATYKKSYITKERHTEETGR